MFVSARWGTMASGKLPEINTIARKIVEYSDFFVEKYSCHSTINVSALLSFSI